MPDFGNYCPIYAHADAQAHASLPNFFHSSSSSGIYSSKDFFLSTYFRNRLVCLGAEHSLAKGRQFDSFRSLFALTFPFSSKLVQEKMLSFQKLKSKSGSGLPFQGNPNNFFNVIVTRIRWIERRQVLLRFDWGHSSSVTQKGYVPEDITSQAKLQTKEYTKENLKSFSQTDEIVMSAPREWTHGEKTSSWDSSRSLRSFGKRNEHFCPAPFSK